MGDREATSLLERKLVHHCAPTLAGIKPGSLFVCQATDSKPGPAGTGENISPAGAGASLPPAGAGASLPLPQAGRILAGIKGRLAPYGVRLIPMAAMRTGLLLYVCRPALLAGTLTHGDAARFLGKFGYAPANVGASIERLRKRLRTAQGKGPRGISPGFPHEIGVFLGYPMHDVIGFIEHGGADYLCCGCWKAYADEEGAKRRFAEIKACTAALEKLYDEGATLEQLALVEWRAAGGNGTAAAC